MNDENADEKVNKAPEGRINRRSLLTAGLVTLSAGLATTSGVLIYNDYEDSKKKKENSFEDLDGNMVTFDEGDAPTKQEIEKMEVEDLSETDRDPSFDIISENNKNEEDQDGSVERGRRGSTSGLKHPGFWVPSVGLSAPVSKVSVVNGVINPPGFRRVYEIRNLGMPLEKAGEGTVYVATHAVRSGLAPGNALIRQDYEGASVKKGDLISLRGVRYRVSDSFVVPKKKLPKTRKVWEVIPGRLVVITCLQRPVRGRALKNSVIFADLEEGQ